MEQLFTPYNGTGGYVERPASIERALDEADSGVLSERQQRVLRYLEYAGMEGATWVEMSKTLNLHHGQISGVLSILHKRGLLFTLRQKREKCHPYVYYQYADNYADDQRYDSPVDTKAGRRRYALERVLDAARLVSKFDGTERDSLNLLREAILWLDYPDEA